MAKPTPPPVKPKDETPKVYTSPPGRAPDISEESAHQTRERDRYWGSLRKRVSHGPSVRV